MASFEGDVILAPGFGRESAAAPVEILYSTVGLLQKGGTLAPGQGGLPAGTAVKFDTATGRYVKATAAADVEGFLRLGVNTGTADSMPKQGVIVFGGVLKADAITAAGLTVDNALATALGGVYDSARKFLKF